MTRGGTTARGARSLGRRAPHVGVGSPPGARLHTLVPRTPPGVAEIIGSENGHLAALFQRAREARAQGRLTEAWACFDRFRRGLLRHMRVEEELVFPAFEIRAGLPSTGPTATMRTEHRDIRNRLEQLALALDEGYEASELEHSLAHMLAEHNRREEAILYPVLDRLLSADEGDMLAAGLRAPRS